MVCIGSGIGGMCDGGLSPLPISMIKGRGHFTGTTFCEEYLLHLRSANSLWQIKTCQMQRRNIWNMPRKHSLTARDHKDHSLLIYP
jgi:hypothetical protein